MWSSNQLRQIFVMLVVIYTSKSQIGRCKYRWDITVMEQRPWLKNISKDCMTTARLLYCPNPGWIRLQLWMFVLALSKTPSNGPERHLYKIFRHCFAKATIIHLQARTNGRNNLSLILLCCYHTVFQSVSTVPDTDPLTITEHQVELVADELDFLWTKVNNLILCYEEVKAFIESFRFPTIVGRLPVTLLWKIVSQNVVSHCRALLSLQPIKQTDAEMLDQLIVRKVHKALGFPFQPSSIIATFPVSHHRFGFPSLCELMRV